MFHWKRTHSGNSVPEIDLLNCTVYDQIQQSLKDFLKYLNNNTDQIKLPLTSVCNCMHVIMYFMFGMSGKTELSCVQNNTCTRTCIYVILVTFHSTNRNNEAIVTFYAFLPLKVDYNVAIVYVCV